MKISACYIVKNEENVIQRSIDSLMDAVDEIILVDTGSTDQTIEVAKKYPKVNIYSYTWQNDFAAARNVAIEKAAGDWIIFLDADEFFPPETVKNIRAVIEKAQSPAVLLVRMKNIESVNGELLTEFWAPRIFRRLPSLRYQGKIHEQLCNPDGSAPEVQLIPADALCLLHTGYSAAQSKAKAQRNLAMLQEAMQHTKHPEELYMYLAEAYYGLGDLIQAERYARMDIAGGRRSITYASRSYRLLLQLLAEKKAYVERKEIAAKAVEIFPELPEFHAELAECLAYDFDFVPAIAAMEKALSMVSAVDSLEISQFDEDCRQIGAQRLGIWRQILDRMKTIKISACLIAKNEAKDLPRWVKNVSAYSDEIVFADTGSNDGTVEIAEKAGIIVHHYPWRDDFSVARNFVLEKAQGDWIAFLDADEFFAAPEKVRGFLAWADCCQSDVDAVMIPISNIDEDDHNLEIQRFSAIRLFQNRKSLRYRGCIHETLYRSDGELQLLRENQRLLVLHTGYSTKRIQQKIQRNMALLQADMAKYGEQPRHYRYLMDCYFGMRDYEQTLHYAMLAIDAPVKAIGSQADVYHGALESMRQLDYPKEKLLAFIQQAIREFPDLPDYYAEQGIVLSSMGNIGKARASLEMAIQLFEYGTSSLSEASYFAGAADIAYRRLAEIYFCQGNKEKAEKYICQALHLHPYRQDNLTCYEHFHEADSAADFAMRLSSFYSKGRSDLEYLQNWADKEELTELFLYFTYRLQQEYGADSFLCSFYEQKQQGKSAELYAAVVENIAVRMPRLFSSLIRWQEYVKDNERELLDKCVKMFPDKVQTLFYAYTGQAEQRSTIDFDAYISILPTVISDNTANQVRHYISLAEEFSVDELIYIVGRLFIMEQWTPAWLLSEDIRRKQDKLDWKFWRGYGICLYYRQDYRGAVSALARARQLGCRMADVSAYQKWSEEGLAHG